MSVSHKRYEFILFGLPSTSLSMESFRQAIQSRADAEFGFEALHKLVEHLLSDCVSFEI